MTSPIRTRSLVTVTLARSTGAAMTSSRVWASAGAAETASRTVARRSERMIIINSPLAEQRGGGLQHLVGGGDDFCVHLVSALRRDQVGNLGDDLDIGLLEIALLHVAKTVGVGDAVLRRAGRRRVREQIVADRLQAGLVDEARHTDLPAGGRRGRSGQGHRNLALRVDGYPRGILRNRDGRLHRIALRVDDAPRGVHLE